MLETSFLLFVAVGALTPVLTIYFCRRSYLLGIRDGAFFHHLPVVRREMLKFDRSRSEEIFEDEGLSGAAPVRFNGG